MIVDGWQLATGWVDTHPGWVVGIVLALAGWQLVSVIAYPRDTRTERGTRAALLVLVETGLLAYDHERECWTVADRLGRSEPVPEVMAEALREHGSGSLFARQYGDTSHDPVKLTDEGHHELVAERRRGKPGRVERVREMWP